MGTFVDWVPLHHDVDEGAAAKRRDTGGTLAPHSTLVTEINGAVRSALRN